MKVLTTDADVAPFSLIPSNGTADLACKLVDASALGSITPIPNAIVVNPTGAPVTQTGAWSGAATFTTLQAAYDSLAADASATIWLVPSDTTVGALVMLAGNTQKLTIRGMGDKQGPPSFVTSIQINNGAVLVTLHDLIVTGDITQEGGEGNYQGALTMYGVEAQGAITLPQAEVLALDYTAINGPSTTQCLDFFARNLRNGPPTINTTNAFIEWDGVSELSYFNGLGHSTIPNATTIARSDDAVATGIIGPDSGFTFLASTIGRAICQPGQLTANRIWKLSHDDTAVRGFVVDVWTQTADLTITDDADATLATIPAASPPQRLFFGAVAGATDFTLRGNLQQNLAGF